MDYRRLRRSFLLIPLDRHSVRLGQSLSEWLFEDGDDVQLAARLLALDKVRQKLPILSRNAEAVSEERADWVKNQKIMLAGYDLAMKLHQERGL